VLLLITTPWHVHTVLLQLVCQSLSTEACPPTKACLLKLCTSHIHVQHVHHCISQHTLHHETDSIPRHTAGIHAHPGCCQASLCSLHQVGLASNIPPTCHNGTAWVLDQAAHAQVSPYLCHRSKMNNNQHSNNSYIECNGNENEDDDGTRMMLVMMIITTD